RTHPGPRPPVLRRSARPRRSSRPLDGRRGRRLGVGPSGAKSAAMKTFLAFAMALPLATMLVLLARAEDGASPGAAAERALVPLDAGTSDTGFPPDPPPLVTRQQWTVRLGYRAGQVIFRGARRIELPKAAPTPRVFGRFALELYVGKELVD